MTYLWIITTHCWTASATPAILATSVPVTATVTATVTDTVTDTADRQSMLQQHIACLNRVTDSTDKGHSTEATATEATAAEVTGYKP